MADTRDVETVGANHPGQLYQSLILLPNYLASQWTQYQNRRVEATNPHSIASHLVSLILLEYNTCVGVFTHSFFEGPGSASMQLLCMKLHYMSEQGINLYFFLFAIHIQHITLFSIHEVKLG